MDKKIFSVYLAKQDATDSEANVRLKLPASPWELHDAMDKVQLQENEELYLEVDDYYGFEFDARLAQDTGKTNFTVPASLLDGYKVMLLDADGNETQLDVDVSGTRATFQLDFGTVVDGHRIPVRMLHLVPTV